MSEIRVLDCTLRDGGYCNEWRFGYDNTKRILEGLVTAGCDIIECGFLTHKYSYDRETTRFTELEQIAEVIPSDRAGKLFVCMMNYGEYDAADMPEYDGTSVDGIRVAFHKKNLTDALELCRAIKAKGYKVFIQAMVSLSYTDLINACNEFMPYAFYIVDSFGVMKRKDMIRLFYMVEHNLADGIWVGFHSHNNMQLAYANAQELVDIKTKRNLIIDSSIFGMGRGAGNLNTELFVEYLNDNIGSEYRLHPLLEIIDEILNAFYQRNSWGYSLPNYISAAHNAHPNYAMYLDNKKTLTMENMNDIFSMMGEEKKVSYDPAYIEGLYTQYLATGHVNEERLNELKEKLSGKKVLVIAPGKSASDEKEKVIKCASREDVIVFSVNFDYREYPSDFIFLSNLRRYREMDKGKLGKCIVTSNIPTDGTYLQTRYKTLMNDTEAVKDNAGLMLIRYLIMLGVETVYIAGLDGYSTDISENFVEAKMAFRSERDVMERMNVGLSKELRRMRNEIQLEYITPPKHVTID